MDDIEDFPRTLNIEENDRNLYTKLKDEDIFTKESTKEQFLFAMAFGFSNDCKLPLEKKSESFARTEYLNSEDIALLYSIVFAYVGDIAVVTDKKRVCNIAQEFAHGGIQLLSDEIDGTQFGTFLKQIEANILEKYNNF